MQEKEQGEVVDASKHGAILILILVGLVGMALGGTLIPGVRDNLSNLFGFGPGTEETLKIGENFNKSIDNMNACDVVDDENCLCEVWPDFPVVFPKDYKLSLDFAGDIGLYKGTKKITEGYLEPQLGVYPLGLSDKGELFYGRDYYLEPEDILFDKEIPYLSKRGTGKILSRYAVKDIIGDLSLTTYYWGEPTQNKISEINTEIEKLPICVEGRTDAIDEFNRIKNSLSTATGDYTLKLPQGFSIKIENSYMSLLYNNELVKNLEYEKTEIIPGRLPGFIASLGLAPRETIYIFKVETMKVPIKLCSTSRTSGLLMNNNLITIKQESGTNCLFF